MVNIVDKIFAFSIVTIKGDNSFVNITFHVMLSDIQVIVASLFNCNRLCTESGVFPILN